MWPNKTMSKHDFKLISNKADISVNVPNVAKHDYVNTRFQDQFNRSYIAVNVQVVAKYFYVNILIRVQFT